MLHYALMFFVVAIVAAVLGMRGVAGLSAEIGYILVVVAMIFLIVAFVAGRGRRRSFEDRHYHHSDHPPRPGIDKPRMIQAAALSCGS